MHGGAIKGVSGYEHKTSKLTNIFVSGSCVRYEYLWRVRFTTRNKFLGDSVSEFAQFQGEACPITHFLTVIAKKDGLVRVMNDTNATDRYKVNFLTFPYPSILLIKWFNRHKLLNGEAGRKKFAVINVHTFSSFEPANHGCPFLQPQGHTTCPY